MKFDLIYKFFTLFLNEKYKTILSVVYFNKLLKMNNLKSKEEEFLLLKKWVKKGDHVLDIGSNIGRYSFELSKIVTENGHVYSFEPMTRPFFIMTCLCFIRNFKNISLFNIGLGSNSGLSKMILKWSDNKDFIFDTNTETSILSDLKYENKNSFNRFILKVDSLVFPKQITFIKIDVEGFELEVLRGAKKLIIKDKPVILVEANDKKINNFLKKLNYKKLNYKHFSRNWLFVKNIE